MSEYYKKYMKYKKKYLSLKEKIGGEITEEELREYERHNALIVSLQEEREEMLTNIIASAPEISLSEEQLQGAVLSNTINSNTLHTIIKENMGLNMLRQFIKEGYYINAKDENGNTPLHIALYTPHNTFRIRYINELSLDKNIDLRIINDEGLTALNLSIRLYNNDIETIHTFFKEHKAEQFINIPYYEATPLFLTVDNNLIKVVKLLLQYKADPNITIGTFRPDHSSTVEVNDYSPLDLAIYKNYTDIVNLLRNNGANERASTSSAVTASL